jgi:alkylation response protein AidB-like acyl-CoA dehydrogenase
MSPAGTAEAIITWLYPLRGMLDPAGRADWDRLTALAAALDAALTRYPVNADLAAGPERSRRLLAIRQTLAEGGYGGTAGQRAPFQVLAQFMCGYRDIDLRDATGLGHGQLIAHHGTPAARQRWIPRLRAGELAGIAITEPHGGSRPAATRTRAVAGPDGTWLVSGRKTWISRLTEAAVFAVFFRAPDGQLVAAAIDASESGLRREQIPPTGLAGWSWGILDLDAVPIRPDEVLHGDGMTLLRDHFASYRPLVAATALGGAAAVFDTVTAAVATRYASGEITRPRDTTLVTVGRVHAQLVTALLGVAAASHLAEAGDPTAERWGAAMKAHAVESADHAAGELALLLGAAGFRADSPIAKTRRDLGGLLYADGILDSLYRAAGKQHTTHQETTVPTPRDAQESIPMTA